MATSKKAATPPPKSIFTLTETNRKKLRSTAGIEGTDMQAIVNQALEEYFERYEKKHGKIPTR